MQFQQTMTLLGVVGKKGKGTLDNGQAWETDRVELHFLSPFPTDDEMSCGQSCAVHQLQDFEGNYNKAKTCIGKEVVVDFTMVASKKLGLAPRVQIVGFNLPSTVKKAG